MTIVLINSDSPNKVGEDGILISKDVLPKLTFKTYEKRVTEYGNKKYPLNVYGDAQAL